MTQGRAVTLRQSHWPLAIIILAGVLLRLTLFPLYAHLTTTLFDETLWKAWMQAGHDHGILNIFRASDADYVGYQWILWLLSLIYAPSGDYSPTAPWLHALVKVPPLIFDVLLIVAVYKATV